MKIHCRKRTEKRREANKESRVNPKVDVALTSLIPDELTERRGRSKNNRHNTEKLQTRMKKKLEETEVIVKMSDELLEEMDEQLKEIHENSIGLRETVTAALKEMFDEEYAGEHNSEKLLSDKDTVELVEFILETLKNHSIQKFGKNNYSFSPYLMGLTMYQYLQGPTAYNIF